MGWEAVITCCMITASLISEVIMRTPFIHFFETPKGKYFYDVNSNAIVKVSFQLYEYLNRGIEHFTEDSDIKTELETLLQAGMLSADRWETIEHPATKLLKENLNGSIEMLTLQVTQQCNLRCRYCPYSGSYYNRKHSSECMDINVAKEAIDFYIKHSFDKQEINIGFYGGEPLIQYDMIKELVSYVYIKGEGKNINFHITTNATLLDLEKISFLAENKFKMTISLDGPRELHDKNRRQINGKGSFDRVIENIKIIQKHYPEYIQGVMFNCVVDGRGDYGCLNDFFTNYDVIKDIHTTFNNIATEGIKDKDLLLSSEEYDNAYQYEVFKLLLNKCNLISEKEVSTIVKSHYDYIRMKLKGKKEGDISSATGHPGGPCVPGIHKLFVNIHGDFFPCEKLNENISEIIIGNAKDGFDFKRIEDILNVGKSTQQECKNCWCSRYCYQCILFSEDGDSLSSKKRLSHCRSVKAATENMFKDYCLIKEAEAEDNNIYFL